MITVQEPQKITVGDAIDNLKVTTTVDGNELDENGEAINSTFSFRLTAADSTDVIANLTATIPAGSNGPVLLSLSDAEAAELSDGTYTIAAIGADSPAWLDTEDVVTFTVTGQDVTLTSTDNNIENNLATYTVTYQAGAEDAGITVPSVESHHYNEIVTLPEATRTGYTFLGWRVYDSTLAADEQDLTVYNELQITKDTTLKAVWFKNPGEEQPVPPTGEPSVAEDGVQVNKTATDLVNDQSNVALTVTGTQAKTVSDVVFVLDKSASEDIRQEAMNMLKELKNQADEGNIVKVGVVNFETGVLEKLDLTSLTDENLETIRTSVIFHDADSSGTNIYAGLVAGKEMLDADTEVAAENKHLVLVTDGVGYLWGSDAEGAYSIYSEKTSNGEECLYASHETIDWHHTDKAYYDEFKDMLKWYNTYGTQYAENMNTYQMPYDEGQYKAKHYGVKSGKGQDTDWSVIEKFENNYSYVPEENETSVASAADVAMYMMAKEWMSIASEYNAYAYADSRYYKNGKYTWAYNAVSNLSDLGGFSAEIPQSEDAYSGMFDAVKSTVLYDIQGGTVTDVIGDNFDVAGLESFKLTVGGVEVPGTVEGSTVTFDDGKYVVTYEPATDTTKEQFIWNINTPVESAKPVQLTYTVKLVNKSTAAGNYTVPTNQEATLTYTSTTGGQGSETFPVPTVSYTVEAPAPVQTPATNTTTATGSSKPVEEATPTPTPAAVVVPQTSDDMPLVTLISVAGIAAAAVVVLVVMRRRRKQ